jgi:hypothetical protein
VNKEVHHLSKIHQSQRVRYRGYFKDYNPLKGLYTISLIITGMEVEAPRTFIFDIEGIESGPRVLIRNNWWERYKQIRDSLSLLDLQADLDSTILRKAADLFLVSASYSVGWIEIRLTAFAVAIYAVLKYISVSPYEIVAYPGILGKAKFPFKLGSETYTIEPIEDL